MKRVKSTVMKITWRVERCVHFYFYIWCVYFFYLIQSPELIGTQKGTQILVFVDFSFIFLNYRVKLFPVHFITDTYVRNCSLGLYSFIICLVANSGPLDKVGIVIDDCLVMVVAYKKSHHIFIRYVNCIFSWIDWIRTAIRVNLLISPNLSRLKDCVGQGQNPEENCST
jgi:hypothetical protein